MEIMGAQLMRNYGPGAPKWNLIFLIQKYYIVNDFYNMMSTATRTIFTNFAPYQQRMQNSSGLAAALMILNHLGEDVYEQYTELELVKMYEQINQTTVYGNDTDPEGLVKLFKQIGYHAESNVYEPVGSTKSAKLITLTYGSRNNLKKVVT